MEVQTIRRHNLGRILSAFELSGISCPCEQARILASIVTPQKLVRMLFASHIDALVARGVEYATGLPRGWMDQSHSRAPRVVQCGPAYRLDPTAPSTESTVPMPEVVSSSRRGAGRTAQSPAPSNPEGPATNAAGAEP